ncbi:MAG TPA: GAP family protein [Mycobacterium sp.]|nr:GAP family protein [Mycobacterium sp.]
MVLLLGLVSVTDPFRNGIAALLSSQPRPLRNLFAYWLGGMAMGIFAGVGLLFVLRGLALSLLHHVTSLAETRAAAHLQTAMGVLALVVAALIAARYSVRQRARVALGGDPSVPMLQTGALNPFSRLSTRAREALMSGSLCVAFVAGVGMATPTEYLVVLSFILASRAAAAAMVGAVVAYTFIAFAVVEIPLISFVASPAKTQAVMMRVNNWLRIRRPQIVAVVFAVVGVFLVSAGITAA